MLAFSSQPAKSIAFKKPSEQPKAALHLQQMQYNSDGVQWLAAELCYHEEGSTKVHANEEKGTSQIN